MADTPQTNDSTGSQKQNRPVVQKTKTESASPVPPVPVDPKSLVEIPSLKYGEDGSSERYVRIRGEN
jgi:hypothetical protein